jgi:hypothetical protein
MRLKHFNVKEKIQLTYGSLNMLLMFYIENIEKTICRAFKKHFKKCPPQIFLSSKKTAYFSPE